MTLKVRPEAAAQIAQLCADAPQLETGGVLVGWRYNEVAAEVVHATGPGPNALLQAREMEWDPSYIQGIMDGIQLTRGGFGIIGRWHKHAAPVILASQQDRHGAEWFRMAIAPEDATVELIVGTGENDMPLAYGAYLCTCDGLQRIECETDATDDEELSPRQLAPADTA